MNLVKWLLLILYLFILLYIVFFALRRREISSHAIVVHVVPFKNTIDSFYSLQKHTLKARLLFFFSNFFGNILLFIPFPFLIIELFKIINPRSIIVIGILASLTIELVQLFGQIGIFDIDDILLNTAGVITGVFLWKTPVIRNK